MRRESGPLLLSFVLSLSLLNCGWGQCITLDFEGLDIGTINPGAYGTEGVQMSKDLGSGSAPGLVINHGSASGHVLEPWESDPKVTFIFDYPVYSFFAPVFEYVQSGGDPDDDDNEEQIGVAMFDFEGGGEDELPVKVGEKLVILKEVGEWLLCRNAAGREGYVPKTYVEIQQSVYLKAYRRNGSNWTLLNPEPLFVSEPGTWQELTYTNPHGFDAIQLHGDPFVVDNIQLNFTPASVPEPSLALPAVLLLLAYLVCRRSHR